MIIHIKFLEVSLKKIFMTESVDIPTLAVIIVSSHTKTLPSYPLSVELLHLVYLGMWVRCQWV